MFRGLVANKAVAYRKWCKAVLLNDLYCVKSARMGSFSGRSFPAFGLNIDQKNPGYRHFSHSVYVKG